MLDVAVFFEDLALFFVEVLGDFDVDADDLGAAVAIGAHRDAVAGEFERGARLGAGGDFHSDGAIDSFDFDFGAENSVDEADVLFG